MNKLLLPLLSAVMVFTVMSCSKLSSQGDSLEPVVKGAAGATYSLTLDQINIERNRTGAYIRLFDSKNKTIFVYVPKKLYNKIVNLERRKKYIYKFKAAKKSTYSTLSGELIDVASLDGKPISSSLKDSSPNPGLIVLEGPDVYGKEYSLTLKFNGKKEEKDKKTATFISTGPYGKAIYCTYDEKNSKKIDGLKKSQQYKVKVKIEKTDWRIFGSLISVE